MEVRPEARYTGKLNRKAKNIYDSQHYIRYLYKIEFREGHNFILKEWRYYSNTKYLVHPRGHVYPYGCWKVNGWTFKLVPKEEFVRLQLTADKVEDLGD